MKRLTAILTLILLSISLLSLVSCGNQDIFDTVYTYDEAIIRLPDGTVVKGKVDSWSDYSDGDQIQVTVDGKIYLVHSSNICLIASAEK